MLSSTYASVPNFTLPNELPNNNEVTKMYYKYLYEEQIHNWAMERWFIELNELLAEKTVIHLFCFSDAKKLSDRLNGYKLKESLHYKSVQLDNLHNENNTEERINHFTKSFNVNFANSLANYYTNEILPNPMQTKYFDIDI
jgi:hypothetical protein